MIGEILIKSGRSWSALMEGLKIMGRNQMRLGHDGRMEFNDGQR